MTARIDYKSMVTLPGQLTYRAYQPGDETQILSLFKLVFHREMGYEFWKWRYRDNPSGLAVSMVAFDGEKLVGHFAVLPMEVQFEGKLFRAIFPVTAMTHPDYAGRGIFTRLITTIYDSCRRNGFLLAYGFFNRNTFYVNVNRAGYREGDVIRMDILEKKLGDTLPPASLGKEIREIKIFDAQVDRLWGRMKGDFRAVVPRTSRFLNWRFSQYEEINYPKFIFEADGEMLGYIVLKIYREGETVKGHIIDLLAVRDEKVVRSLIHKSYEYFRGKGVPDISCWMMKNSYFSRILESEGFKRTEGATNFGCQLLDKSQKELLPIEKSAHWHLTMGDSDVF
ncbi:MAG: GNAT family N-acetyltransferase [Chloroflexota bacterium]